MSRRCVLLLLLLGLVLVLPTTHGFSSTVRTAVQSVTENVVDLEIKEYQTSSNITQNNTEPTELSTIPNNVQEQRKYIFIGMLAIFYACADIICFKTFDCFASMMTGNMIRSSIALADGRWIDGLHRGTLVINYIVGAMLYKVIQNDKNLKVAPTAFVLFVAADVIGRFAGNQYSPLVMALAFGIINADAQITSGIVANAATGHMSKVGQSIGDALVAGIPMPKTSVKFLTWFGLGLLLSNVLHQFWMKPLQYPPIGLVLGAGYWTLRSWYDSAPRGSLIP